MGFAISLKPVLITGLTASGKSSLAIALARGLEGADGRSSLVINADASQVYRGLETLTAQPSATEQAGVVHRLFGFVPPQEAYSVGRWLADVEGVLREDCAEDCTAEGGARPIFCGGSGLYFRALTEGLAEVPEVASEVRARLEARLEEIGVAAFYEELRELDAQEAARLADKNPRRLLRAREVLEATGKPLHFWWEKQAPPLINRALWVVLLPDLEALEAAIAKRAPYLVGKAGQEEVRALKEQNADLDSLPSYRALGVAEVEQVLDGTLSEEQAAESLVLRTRQYARRQRVWWQKHLPSAVGAIGTTGGQDTGGQGGQDMGGQGSQDIGGQGAHRVLVLHRRFGGESAVVEQVFAAIRALEGV